jgi:hypothetical protein
MFRRASWVLITAACSSTTPDVAPAPTLADEPATAPPTEPAPPTESAAPSTPPPTSKALTDDEKLDKAFKPERLTEHKLGFHYLAMGSEIESAGTPADRVVIFEDKDFDKNDTLPRASRIVVMLAPDDTLVRGAAAKLVTDAVTKYATIRGMAPGMFSLADTPCTSVHYEASCYAGRGEYLAQAGMGGLSRSFEFYVLIAERDGRRALIVAFEREARSAQLQARGTIRLAKS